MFRQRRRRFYVGLAIQDHSSWRWSRFPDSCQRKSLENRYMWSKHFPPEFNKTSVDAGSIWANLVTPLDSGTPLIKEFVLRTFGTANWTQFCPGLMDPATAGNKTSGREVEFFCGVKWT